MELHGQWGNHLHTYCRKAYSNVFARRGGGRIPRADIYLKFEFSALDIPILAAGGYRQIQWDTVGFRTLSTTIFAFSVGVQTTKYVGGGPGAKVSGPIVT